MTFSELILTLPPDTKSLIRSIEKTNRKIFNIQLSLVFNKTCVYIYTFAPPRCRTFHYRRNFRCLFGTILVTLCLMVWDWLVSRAEPILSCWHDLLFLFCLLLFYLFLHSMGWLCGVVVFGLIEYSHSLPALHSGLQVIIIIIIIIIK